MIQVNKIGFSYPHSAPVFQDFSWQVDSGETWAILGPSGCGKTTLLYLLAGLLKTANGEVVIDGQPLERPRPRTGLILQDYGLLPWATVRENVNLGLKVREFYGPDGTHSPRSREKAPDMKIWFERLGLSDLANKFPAQISDGQRQRVAIARTLALDPDLLLMDEPFSSLDAVTRADLQALTLQLCSEQGITMVIVTHSIEEAAELGRKILILGFPPNSHTKIFDNQASGNPGFRQSDLFNEICLKLRQGMERS